jgi:hypothetical protein
MKNNIIYLINKYYKDACFISVRFILYALGNGHVESACPLISVSSFTNRYFSDSINID